jgi:hypothetical protein
LSFDFNLIDNLLYFSVLNNFRLGNILEVRVLEEVRVGGAGGGQVGYQNSQLDVSYMEVRVRKHP